MCIHMPSPTVMYTIHIKFPQAYVHPHVDMLICMRSAPRQKAHLHIHAFSLSETLSFRGEDEESEPRVLRCSLPFSVTPEDSEQLHTGEQRKRALEGPGTWAGSLQGRPDPYLYLLDWSPHHSGEAEAPSTSSLHPVSCELDAGMQPSSRYNPQILSLPPAFCSCPGGGVR